MKELHLARVAHWATRLVSIGAPGHKAHSMHIHSHKAHSIHDTFAEMYKIAKEKLSWLSYFSNWLFYSVAPSKLLHVFVCQSNLAGGKLFFSDIPAL